MLLQTESNAPTLWNDCIRNLTPALSEGEGAQSVKSVVKNKATSKIMKKETIKYIIQLIVAILTAIGSTLSVTTAASGAPAEGVALLGGTIVGTGWLHHLSTLV